MSPRWGLLAAEVIERDSELVIRLEVPGMEPSELDVQVQDGHLIVRGEKRVRQEETRGRYHVLECAYGRFERIVPLPVSVDQAQAKAKYRHGVLRVSLPKIGGAKAKRIEVDHS